MAINQIMNKKTVYYNGDNLLLNHCQLTNIPSEYSICDLFAKLVAYPRN